MILSSCDIAALKAGRRRVALACKIFLSKLERCTECGPQGRSWGTAVFKFLTRQLVSLNKTNIISSVVDGKPFVACGFCGAKISSVIGYNTINIPDIFQVFTAI